VLSAGFGTVFVSKGEVKYYPIIGQIAWLAGILFLDRSSSRERRRILKTIACNYSNRVLTVFPQGTTGSVTDRLPFNRGIFKVAELNSDIVLLPVTLRYEEDKEIAWSRPQSLKENSARVFAQRKIRVTVTVHDPVTADDYRGKTTDQICRMVEETVLGPLKKGQS
jgi:1-acyl-sn-glycerol-3-phosphate acyltransferase